MDPQPSSSSRPPASTPVFTTTDSRHSGVINNVNGNFITHVNHSSPFQDQPMSESRASGEGNSSVLAALHGVTRGHYYVPACMPGTRDWIIDEIHRWLDDFNTPNILWLSGEEGTGKSAVASAVVSHLQDVGRLGSYFFCKHDDQLLSDPAAIWRTVASDFARRWPDIADRISHHMRQGRVDPERPDIAQHFKYFIEDPSKQCVEPILMAFIESNQGGVKSEHFPDVGDAMSISTDADLLLSRSSVVVIDALDECGSAANQSSQRRAFLNSLSRWTTLHPCLKLFITSRDPPATVPSLRGLHQHMRLPGSDHISPLVTADIKFYLEKRLSELNISGSNSVPTWPGSAVVEWMSCCAAGSFKWAEFVMDFLEQGVAEDRLEMLTGNHIPAINQNTGVIQKAITRLPFQDWKPKGLQTGKKSGQTKSATPAHVTDSPGPSVFHHHSPGGLRLLSLDAGGIRSMSQLIILKKIFKRIKDEDKLDSEPLPSDYFDMISGTGSGGLIAIMLGRLRMSVAEAIECYDSIATKMFSKKQMLAKWLYSESTLEDAIRTLIKIRTGDADESLLDRSENQVCKTFVCAQAANRMNAPNSILFRTYSARRGYSHYDCTIWKAARATLADPMFFKQVEIGPSFNFQQSYIIGAYNPTQELIREAKLTFPDRPTALILSIGTGHRHYITLPQPSWWQSAASVLAAQALTFSTDCERVAKEVEDRFEDSPGIYVRLNVAYALQNIQLNEWDRLDEVAAHTEQWMQLGVVDEDIDSVVESLRKPRQSASS
ncbi:hypothetical protein HWV62_8150 [Athelia sp. TMB]|nr:hypothetical protein HWV62_8150 [Athelia sp. TMB]